ncbi:hypothetical protein AB6806_10870 [Bosea sp. RCC_152_1]|uniref:hypothetical protein n=1 Tax=Bosea sp. RCC_152_1 TaxID=3239228 RepID=UPI0035256445
MTDIAEIRQSVAEAQTRLDDLAAAAELAADRGGRGPSPKEIADAEWLLAHHQRRLDLARSTVSTPLTAVIERGR